MENLDIGQKPMIKINVDRGYIELQDVMGTDSDIVSAARTSYLGHSKGEEADKKLLFYLMKNAHATPFECAILRFRVKCPIMVARQWFRHRTWSFSERSGRYTEFHEREYYTPDEWRSPDKVNKQGSISTFSEDQSMYFTNVYTEAMEKIFDTYEWMLEQGIAKEQARLILPVSIYTEFVGVIDLRNLLQFIKLRSDHHAQWEIQQYSNALKEIVKEKFPWTYEAAVEYGVI